MIRIDQLDFFKGYNMLKRKKRLNRAFAYSVILLSLFLLSVLLASADKPGTCKNPNGGNYCGTKSKVSNCYCDAACVSAGDCCMDHISVCLRQSSKSRTTASPRDLVGGAVAPLSVTRTIFVSSQAYAGNLGGLAGADQKCQALADKAGLQGTFKAWLSDARTAAKDRLTQTTRPYKLLDGKLIANNWDDLVDGKLDAPISLTETKKTFNSMVWTNTDVQGDIDSTVDACDDWTNSLRAKKGNFGRSSAIDKKWTQSASARCSFSARLYCIED